MVVPSESFSRLRAERDCAEGWGMSEREVLEIIRGWKHFWMNQNQHSEEDRKNYFDRAFEIDANMVHDLARRMQERFGGHQKTERKDGE